MKTDKEIREEVNRWEEEIKERKDGIGEEKRWLHFKEAADSKVDHLFMETAQ